MAAKSPSNEPIGPTVHSPVRRTRTVFLSHSSFDKEFARQLGQRLEAFGLNVWIDQGEIKPGDSLSERIGSALAEVDVICAILSPDAIVSDWVGKEIRLARRRYKSLRDIKLIPIIYRSARIPRTLSDFLSIDFSDKPGYELALGRLLDAMNVFAFPEGGLSQQDINAQLACISRGSPILETILSEVRQVRQISVAAGLSLAKAAVPPSLLELFLYLIAAGNPEGGVRFAVALISVDLIDQIRVGRKALEFCLEGDNLSADRRESVGRRMCTVSDADALAYLHRLFVQRIRNDAVYNSLIDKQFKTLMQVCYDEVRAYLLHPNRGPKGLNLDTVFTILNHDPTATDFQRRVIDWINDGEFDKAEGINLYQICNTILTNGMEHLYFIPNQLEERLRSLLKSRQRIGAAIYHLNAMCQAEYVNLSAVQKLVEERSGSAEAFEWPEKAALLINCLIEHMRILETHSQNRELLLLQSTQRISRLDDFSGFFSSLQRLTS